MFWTRLLDLIRWLGPRTKCREWFAFLPPPWSGTRVSVACSEAKYGSQRGVVEKQQRQSLSRMESLQLPYLTPTPAKFWWLWYFGSRVLVSPTLNFQTLNKRNSGNSLIQLSVRVNVFPCNWIGPNIVSRPTVRLLAIPALHQAALEMLMGKWQCFKFSVPGF